MQARVDELREELAEKARASSRNVSLTVHAIGATQASQWYCHGHPFNITSYPHFLQTVEEVEQVEKQLSAAERGLQRFMAYRDRRRSAKTEGGPSLSEQQKHYNDVLRNQEHIQDFGVFDDLDTWINRLIIHNPKVVITQQIRDILLRYHYSSRSKRLLDCKQRLTASHRARSAIPKADGALLLMAYRRCDDCESNQVHQGSL